MCLSMPQTCPKYASPSVANFYPEMRAKIFQQTVANFVCKKNAVTVFSAGEGEKMCQNSMLNAPPPPQKCNSNMAFFMGVLGYIVECASW